MQGWWRARLPAQQLYGVMAGWSRARDSNGKSPQQVRLPPRLQRSQRKGKVGQGHSHGNASRQGLNVAGAMAEPSGVANSYCIASVALYAGQQCACVRTHNYSAESLVHASGCGPNRGARSGGRSPCYGCQRVLGTWPPPAKALCDYGYELKPQCRALAGCVAVTEFGGFVLDCRGELRSCGIPNLGKLYW